jgi:hypothetical protein
MNEKNEVFVNKKIDKLDITNITDEEMITKRNDLTSYFAKRDHSINQVYQSEVFIEKLILFYLID